MAPKQGIAIGIRLFAIWLAIYFARMLPAFYHQMVLTVDPYANLIAAGVVAFTIAAILVLWFFPRTIAGVLLESSGPIATEPASPDTWFAVGCALLGLWLIVPALSSLLYNLSILYLSQRTSDVDTSNISYGLIYYVIEITFGVWLLLGARGARTLFWWARARDAD
jgi:hypothetical protein